jgi:pSer/pThr/pTyr-binding forkhead associated (FHA) protein
MEIHFKLVHKTNTTITKVSKVDYINQFSLKEGENVIIGRHPDSSIRVSDDFCSGRHCELRVQNSKVVIKDLGSKNGTILNDISITEDYFYPDDILKIGSHYIIFDLSRNSRSMIDRLRKSKTA